MCVTGSRKCHNIYIYIYIYICICVIENHNFWTVYRTEVVDPSFCCYKMAVYKKWCVNPHVVTSLLTSALFSSDVSTFYLKIRLSPREKHNFWTVYRREVVDPSFCCYKMAVYKKWCVTPHLVTILLTSALFNSDGSTFYVKIRLSLHINRLIL